MMRVGAVCGLFAFLLLTGCAPREFDRALLYYADRDHVRDSGVRRTSAAWYLRFNTAMLQDIDSALETADIEAAKAQTIATLTSAGALAQRSLDAEIDRLTSESRGELARRAELPNDVSELKQAATQRAKDGLKTELEKLASAPDEQWRRRVRQIRAGVEPLPDDQGRVARQVLWAGFAIPVAAGINAKEKEIRDELRTRAAKPLARAAVWTPSAANSTALERFSPRIAVEWPENRGYPEDYDRIGRVALAGPANDIEVQIQPTHPTVYVYESTALVLGKRRPQLNYVWWFSDRPTISRDDLAAGHVDGGTLRLTLDGQGRPAIAEIILNCGCDHEVYVSEVLEAASRNEFGGPLPNARFSVERPDIGRYPLLVAGTFRSLSGARPTVMLDAGSHTPRGFALLAPGETPAETVIEQGAYDALDYDALDRLPLGDGFASLFDEDGLVRSAARPESYLMIPSGMLNAGQPRKRGTQRIRWDAYLFDDPTLLVRALRLPRDF